jgi:hypothetical protein
MTPSSSSQKSQPVDRRQPVTARDLLGPARLVRQVVLADDDAADRDVAIGCRPARAVEDVADDVLGAAAEVDPVVLGAHRVVIVECADWVVGHQERIQSGVEADLAGLVAEPRVELRRCHGPRAIDVERGDREGERFNPPLARRSRA